MTPEFEFKSRKNSQAPKKFAKIREFPKNSQKFANSWKIRTNSGVLGLAITLTFFSHFFALALFTPSIHRRR